MVIDFERAEIVKAIRKRKRLCGAKKADGKDSMVDMMKEDSIMRLRVALDVSAARMMFDPTVPVVAV